MIETLLSDFKWYRKANGGKWYYVGVLINCGMDKLFYWTNRKPDNYFEQIRQIEKH